MPFHPLRILYGAAGRMRSALAACILAAVTIASIICVVHPQTAGHSHGETLAPPHHRTAEFTSGAPQVPDSAELCLPAGRSLAEANPAPAHTPAAAIPAVTGVTISFPMARRQPVPRRLAVNTGRFTLIRDCRWRI